LNLEAWIWLPDAQLFENSKRLEKYMYLDMNEQEIIKVYYCTAGCTAIRKLEKAGEMYVFRHEQ